MCVCVCVFVYVCVYVCVCTQGKEHPLSKTVCVCVCVCTRGVCVQTPARETQQPQTGCPEHHSRQRYTGSVCLASSRVIFLTCVPSLVLINIPLKRVKRSSWFTSAKTRGHLVGLVSISDLLVKPPSHNKLLCYWSEMFLEHGATENTQSRGTSRQHRTLALENAVTFQQLVQWELAGRRAEGQGPNCRRSLHTTSPYLSLNGAHFHTAWSCISRLHQVLSLGFLKLSQGQKHHEGCCHKETSVAMAPTCCSRTWRYEEEEVWSGGKCWEKRILEKREVLKNVRCV